MRSSLEHVGRESEAELGRERRRIAERVDAVATEHDVGAARLDQRADRGFEVSGSNSAPPP
jgi:hypothetical protein